MSKEVGGMVGSKRVRGAGSARRLGRGPWRPGSGGARAGGGTCVQETGCGTVVIVSKTARPQHVGVPVLEKDRRQVDQLAADRDADRALDRRTGKDHRGRDESRENGPRSLLRLAVPVVRGHARPGQVGCAADFGGGHVGFKDVPRISGGFVPVCASDVDPHVSEH